MADNDNYVYRNLETIATGIFLNIDNNLLAACQKAVQSKVLEICGSLSECDAFEDDNVIGADSLISYKNSSGDTVIEGLMNIAALTFDDRDPNNPRFHRSQVPNYTKDRITAAINTIENRALQKFNVLSTDLTIQRCVEGRDDKWRYKGSGGGTDNFQRFPNLLKSYSQMIFNSALDKAYLNYSTKYNEYLAKALEDQNDDVKLMLCNAISYNEGSAYCTQYGTIGSEGEPICTAYAAYGALENIFNEDAVQSESENGGSMSGIRTGSRSNTGTSGLSDDGFRYIVKGADIATKLRNMSKGKGEFIQTNKDGRMIGKISMKSIYNAGTNTCTITTVTTACRSEKEIVWLKSTDKVKDKKYEDGTTKKYVCDDCEYKFEGTMCSEFSDPVTEVNEIQM